MSPPKCDNENVTPEGVGSIFSVRLQKDYFGGSIIDLFETVSENRGGDLALRCKLCLRVYFASWHLRKRKT
jgi:hypothetical protein